MPTQVTSSHAPARSPRATLSATSHASCRIVRVLDARRFVLIGRTLSHYRVTAAIGAGGMGEVFRATDTKLGREVALKVLPAGMDRDPARLARFQREARAVAALNNPHIVTIFSVEEADGVHFLTMELVEGQSLTDLITPGGMPAAQLIHIATALADALRPLVESPALRREIGAASRTYVERVHDIDHVADRLLDVYRSL